ncbi:MAG TPA: KpsF/GutQ family sugar-phosphate isomerase [Chthoniobacteraceae bacterium]|nr:KpsF/GutQ family sugar-phosphate isomerase [Chthoniobacteraceae bacterium]
MIDHLSKARRVFAIEAAEAARVADRLDETFVRAVETIREALARRNKIVVVGVGKSGHIGDKIAATLTSTGSPAVVLNSLNALHGDLGVVSDGDIILALSYSGQTDELLNILPALKRFEVTLIALTGNPASILARHADLHLNVSIDREACPLGLAPTSSTTAMLMLGDALAMVLLEARGFRKEDFARYHPGGRLGRTLLLGVSEIMRCGEALALLPPESRIRDVLRAMAKARTGSAILTHPDGSLAGIFTHGDFGRTIDTIPDLLERPVAEFMTPHPVTIAANQLAVEVLHLLKRHSIDDLVVVEEKEGLRFPVGLVDSQDLAKFRLV